MDNKYPATYSEQKAIIEKERALNKNAQELSNSFRIADVFINKNYLDIFHNASLVREDNHSVCDIAKLRVLELTKIVFDEQEDINDKLSGVYNALYNLNISVAFYIVGRKEETRFYFVTRSEHIAPLAGEVMESMVRGNFPGAKIHTLNYEESKKTIEGLSVNEYGEKTIKGLASISMIPSEKSEEKQEKKFVQGLEKFIETMQHKEYVAILLAVPLGKEAVTNRKHGLEEMYSILSPHAKVSIAYGENVSTAVNKGMSQSFSDSMNESVTNTNSASTSNTMGTTSTRSSGSSFGGGSSGEGSSSNWGFNSGTSSSSSSSYTSGTSFSNSIAKSVGTTETSTVNVGTTDTAGSSLTHTLNFDNKGVAELLQKIDEQIKRIKSWESYGLWETCGYFFSQDISTSVLAATTYKALMTGEGSGVERAHVNIWENKIAQEKQGVQEIFERVKYMIHPKAEIKGGNGIAPQVVSPTSLVGGNELPILLGLPRKSVKGVSVVEMAEFGRDVIYEDYQPRRSFSIGRIYHMGIEEITKVNMNLDVFSSHCFITGSSGSGKSYATYNLLDALLKKGIKMLVIEPAKGEYKQVFGRLDKIQIFTTNIDTYKMIRLNPFQFPEELHVLAHIEQLLQIFNASWPLYAAMPAILKEAVVEAYINCGWDIKNSIWIENSMHRKYPVFADVLETLPRIINTSDYSADSKGDYKGALVTRVQSMTMGIIGEIFKNSEGIEEKVLFDGNTIIDLSEVGSEETVALMMGIVIMKLNEYRRSQRKKNPDDGHDSAFRHVTVLEEAHNLLKRTSKDQNQEGANMVGKSVEMISNSIKEMRTYGEGFIIIDQSPLAVDASAVENTATKIIMNTPSKDACEELGSALALNENQTRELSRLNVGVAAVMQKGWMQPVLMKVRGDWKMSDYEAPLQIAIPGIVRFVRGKLVEEVMAQVHENKFSARKFKNVIRNADSLVKIKKGDALEHGKAAGRRELQEWNTYQWFRDRKSEFEGAAEMFQRFASDGGAFTKQKIGRILVEIMQCDRLFGLVPPAEILSGAEAEGETQDAGFFDGQLREARRWNRNFKECLEKYVQAPEEDILNKAIIYMLETVIKTQDLDHCKYIVLQMYLQLLLELDGNE